MNKNDILIIFIKSPENGQVKTRLASYLDDRQITLIYQSMAEDLLSHFEKNTSFDLKICFWPPESFNEIKKWLGHNHRYEAQIKGNLGRKMQAAFSKAFDEGYRKVVLIGSDLPTLNEQDVHEAFSRLENNTAVIGPCIDGGYYLIGLKQPEARLFENVNWGTEKVFHQTMENAKSCNLSIALLSEKSDIDRFTDLQDLWKELNNGMLADEKFSIHHTFLILKSIFKKPKLV
jgi:rSAM/selenodomain-associated transferase 1